MAFVENKYNNFNDGVKTGDVLILKYVTGSGYPIQEHFLVENLGNKYNLYDFETNEFVSSEFKEKLSDVLDEITKYGAYAVAPSDQVMITLLSEAPTLKADEGVSPFVTKVVENTPEEGKYEPKPDGSTTTVSPISSTTSTSTQATNTEQPDNNPAPKDET